MARHKLSDLKCKQAKPGERVRYLNDGDGLRLLIRPDGGRYWLLRYRFDGKESTHSLGTYPELSLIDARKGAEAAKAIVAAGGHPTRERAVRRAQRTQASKATFRAVAEEWLTENSPTWSAHHLERNTGLLTRLLYPDLGELPIGDISESMLLATLRKAYTSGIRESARRARSVASGVFAFAKGSHRATANPAAALAGNPLLKPVAVQHFAALKREQVGPMLRALAESELGYPTKAALLLMLFTGLRDAALRGARWVEIDFASATWTVPAARMKSGREHRIPLPTQAVAVLRDLAKLNGSEPDTYLFSSAGRAGHLAENTLRLALHRLGFKVTAHGFRSLLTDVLNVQGFNPDWIERQLDHVLRGVRASYLHTDFLDQRRGMMQWLADWAEGQKNGTVEPPMPGNVTMLRRVA